jgi:hypothetical protein
MISVKMSFFSNAGFRTSEMDGEGKKEERERKKEWNRGIEE